MCSDWSGQRPREVRSVIFHTTFELRIESCLNLDVDLKRSWGPKLSGSGHPPLPAELAYEADMGKQMNIVLVIRLQYTIITHPRYLGSRLGR